MKEITRSWLQIHFCVVLWGFTAILGKLITLPAPQLVWWRMLLVSASLICVPRVWRGLQSMPGRLLLTYAGIGVLISMHWLAFYAAIKLSNASVAATCMATAPLFLAWIEPLITARQFNARETWLGVLAIPAVAMVVGGTPTDMRLGIFVGIVAAALVAVFAALNKRFVHRADAMTVTGIEMAAGAVLLSLVGPLITFDTPMFNVPNTMDFVLLLVLAFGCTLLPFVLALIALRHLSAFGTQLATSLEPVYAIVLAIPILHEERELNWQFYVGVVGILVVVFSYPFRRGGSRIADSG
jgi:drug/metabolite transporter (DMT)-like permease